MNGRAGWVYARVRDSAVWRYVRAPCPLDLVTWCVLLLVLFQYATWRGAFATFFICAVLGGAALLLRLPRGVVYILVLAGVLSVVCAQVLVNAEGRDDILSDRDESVENGARYLLAGRNPWEARTEINAVITMGPFDILCATPAVWATGKVNAVSLAFWCGFVLWLVVGDLRRRNSSLLILLMCFMLFEFRFQHTMYFSGEEIAFPMLLLPLLPYAVRRDRLEAAGAILGILLMTRLSYIFAAIGFWLWFWLGRDKWRWRDHVRLAAGAVVAMAVIWAPFVLACGKGVWTLNYVTMTGYHAGYEIANANWIYICLNGIARRLPVILQGVFKGGLVVLSQVMVAWVWRREPRPDPFWHMALGLFLGHMIVYHPEDPVDYYVLFLVPMFYAVAFSVPCSNSAHGKRLG